MKHKPASGKLEILAQLRPMMRMVDILVKSGNAIAGPLVMQAREPHVIPEPTLSISMDAAQALMDDLWHCGLRPSEGTGSAGALAATQSHLADMRSIAFNLLKTPPFPDNGPNSAYKQTDPNPCIPHEHLFKEPM